MFWRILVGILAVLLVLILVGPLVIPIRPLADTLPPERLADADSRFVEVAGVKIHYKVFGSGQPVMILLHGFGASTFSWREVTGPLSQSGTVIVYDRPAFGLTERPLPGSWVGQNPYSEPAQVTILFGLMDALEVRSAILVGNSAGGSVAVNAALTQPDRVQALVLVDAAIYDSGRTVPAWLRWVSHTPQAERIGPLLTRSIASRGIEILFSAWHDRARIMPEIIRGYRLPLRAQNWDVALWQYTTAAQPGNLSAHLAELHLPTLVITGDDDRIVPTANSLRLAQEIPGAQLVVVKDCGHVPQEECPVDFLQAVRPFVARSSSTE